jgi:hypothetical protein
MRTRSARSRARGAELPHRLVVSAKSWLCNPATSIAPRDLPWRGASAIWPDGERVSPVNASARYLAHLRAAWDDAHPDAPSPIRTCWSPCRRRSTRWRAS